MPNFMSGVLNRAAAGEQRAATEGGLKRSASKYRPPCTIATHGRLFRGVRGTPLSPIAQSPVSSVGTPRRRSSRFAFTGSPLHSASAEDARGGGSGAAALDIDPATPTRRRPRPSLRSVFSGPAHDDNSVADGSFYRQALEFGPTPSTRNRPLPTLDTTPAGPALGDGSSVYGFGEAAPQPRRKAPPSNCPTRALKAIMAGPMGPQVVTMSGSLPSFSPQAQLPQQAPQDTARGQGTHDLLATAPAPVPAPAHSMICPGLRAPPGLPMPDASLRRSNAGCVASDPATRAGIAGRTLPAAGLPPGHLALKRGVQLKLTDAVPRAPDTSACAPGSGRKGGPLLAVGPSQEHSPVKRSKWEQTLTRAQEVRLPLKVRLPESFSMCSKKLDPSMPAKKRPVFAELSGSAVAQAFEKLDPSMPVRMKVPDFLIGVCTPAAPR